MSTETTVPPQSAPPSGSPVRVTLSRSKGWKLPPDTVVVARPSAYGNPYRVGDHGCNGVPYTAQMAVELFEHYTAPALAEDGMIEKLRGKNLACWCKPDAPCHADVLLRLANGAGCATEGRLP